MNFTQDVTDFHCKAIREALKKNKGSNLVACVNYLKEHATCAITRANWNWVGHQLVVSGWLTVTDQNLFAIRSDP